MKEPETRTLDDDICVHIFTVSATMVGVPHGDRHHPADHHPAAAGADHLVALNMLLYVVSAFCAYWSLRAHRTRRSQAVVRIADCVFLVALLFTAEPPYRVHRSG